MLGAFGGRVACYSCRGDERCLTKLFSGAYRWVQGDGSSCWRGNWGMSDVMIALERSRRSREMCMSVYYVRVWQLSGA